MKHILFFLILILSTCLLTAQNSKKAEDYAGWLSSLNKKKQYEKMAAIYDSLFAAPHNVLQELPGQSFYYQQQIRAVSYHNTKQYDKAYQLYETITRSPHRTQNVTDWAYGSMGKVLRIKFEQTGDTLLIPQIDELYKKALAQNNSATLLAGKAEVYTRIGEITWKEMYYDIAIEASEQALSGNKDNIKYLNRYPQTLRDKADIMDDGTEYYKKSCEFAERLIDYYKDKRQIYYDDDDKLVHKNKNHAMIYRDAGLSWVRLAKKHNDREYFNKGLFNLEQAIAVDPDDANNYMFAGIGYQDAGYANNNRYQIDYSIDLFAKAEERCSDCMQMNLSCARSYFLRSTLTKDTAGLNNALARFDRAFELQPVKKSSPYYGKGQTYRQMGYITKNTDYLNQALKWFRKAGQIQPNGLINTQIAIVYIYLSDFGNNPQLLDSALIHAQTGYNEKNESYTLATIHALKGNNEKALELLDTALTDKGTTIQTIFENKYWKHLYSDTRFKAIIRRHQPNYAIISGRKN